MSDAASSISLTPAASPRARLMQSPPPRKRRRVETDKESDIVEIPDERKRLACPFFKRKSTQTRLSCVYPGFSSIARLKEHLYRQHMLPENLCPRCLETFKSEAELREHSRALSPCPVDTETHIEGITRDQEKALKSKKRTSKSGSRTDEEKWRDIYGILFPDERIPDAFCKIIGPDQDPLKPLKDALNAVKRDLPDFVAQRLKEVSSELFSFNLEDPIPQITQIVSDGLDRFIPDTILANSGSECPTSVHTERSPVSSALDINPSQMPSPMITSSQRQIRSPSSFQSILGSDHPASDPCLIPSANPKPKHVSPIHSPDGRLDSSHVATEEANEHAAEPTLPATWGDNTDQIDGIFDFDL